MTFAPDSEPGIYGKLPSNGDFVTRRLPATFVGSWDRWLQESIADSQEQLGERWLDTYLTSPVWRFALSSGAAGQSSWAGLLMPSVDRVGRYFPLTLACPLPADSGPVGIMTGAESWFESAEALLLACLEQDLELAAFDEQVRKLGTPRSASESRGLLPGMTGARRMPLSGNFEGLCQGLLHQTLGELFFAFSLWWSKGSDVVEPSFLLCQGLPPSAGFSGMLVGDWNRWGWEQAEVFPIEEAPSGLQDR
jgi:type VI secretion system protein ImpM